MQYFMLKPGYQSVTQNVRFSHNPGGIIKSIRNSGVTWHLPKSTLQHWHSQHAPTWMKVCVCFVLFCFFPFFPVTFIWTIFCCKFKRKSVAVSWELHISVLHSRYIPLLSRLFPSVCCCRCLFLRKEIIRYEVWKVRAKKMTKNLNWTKELQIRQREP